MTSNRLKASLFAPGIQKRAVIIALIVGTVLNCINQGPEVVQGDSINWLKLMLTYMVPYCVSTYSAIAASQ